MFVICLEQISHICSCFMVKMAEKLGHATGNLVPGRGGYTDCNNEIV